MSYVGAMQIFIILLIVGGFVWGLILDHWSAKGWDKPIPSIVKGFYSVQDYLKAKNYDKASEKISLIKSSLSLVIILGLILGGGFNFLDHWARSITEHSIGLPLLYFGVLYFVSDVIGIPFSWYNTFTIEEKYGFNKTTPKTFFMDLIKGWVLTLIIGGGLLSIILIIYSKVPEYFWLLAWLTLSVFTLFMALFYVRLLLPIFNKLSPLQDGELKTAISEFAEKAGFKLNRIFVIDGSKRSTKANAFFSGWGQEKTIVLYDTLIEKQTTDEIVAILAHEIGHYKLKHIPKGLVLNFIQSFVTFFLLGLFIKYPFFSNAIGVDQPGIHTALIAFALLYSPVELILGLFNNGLSRKNEYEADAYASSFDLNQPLGTALIKMSAFHLSNLFPNKWDVFFNYSHPTLLQRLKAMDYKTTNYESISTTP